MGLTSMWSAPISCQSSSATGNAGQCGPPQAVIVCGTGGSGDLHARFIMFHPHIGDDHLAYSRVCSFDLLLPPRCRRVHLKPTGSRGWPSWSTIRLLHRPPAGCDAHSEFSSRAPECLASGNTSLKAAPAVQQYEGRRHHVCCVTADSGYSRSSSLLSELFEAVGHPRASDDTFCSSATFFFELRPTRTTRMASPMGRCGGDLFHQ